MRFYVDNGGFTGLLRHGFNCRGTLTVISRSMELAASGASLALAGFVVRTNALPPKKYESPCHCCPAGSCHEVSQPARTRTGLSLPPVIGRTSIAFNIAAPRKEAKLR